MSLNAVSKLLLDCRQGWPVADYRVAGWRPQRVLTQLHGKEPDEAATKMFAEQWPTDELAILDIEHWKLPQEIDKYIKVVDWFRAVRPELRIGYYSMIPQRSYWAPFLGEQAERAWNQHNASLGRTRVNGKFDSRGLADVVDFVCPSLYSFYLNGSNWDHEKIWIEHYAPKNIAAARAYQKQVYPFVWLRVHPGNTDQILPLDHFRRQIEFCLEHADGVCIWDWADASTGNAVLEQTSKIMREFV